MYKIYIKYFGELIDEISGIDGSGDCAENYELGEEYIVENVKLLEEKINDLIENATSKVLGNPFVVDSETEVDINKILKTVENDKEYIIRLFNEKQEKWNCYYEIIIKKISRLEDFYKTYNKIYLDTINQIQEEVHKKYEKTKNKIFETKKENLFCEVSLLQEVEKFLDNEKNTLMLNIDYLKVIMKNLDCFVDEILSIYYNSDFGNSYKDIEEMIKIFVEDFE